jgi:hypothetical protein
VHHTCSEKKGEKVFLVQHDGLEHTIYDAEDANGETRKNTPQIIDEINKHLKEGAPEDLEDFTVEGIAGKIGINKNNLYEWVKTDPEFSEALGRLKDIQKDDPFKTGTVEDIRVNAMALALLLLETKDRHYKSQNL